MPVDRAAEIVGLLQQASEQPVRILRLATVAGVAAPRVAVIYDGESVQSGQLPVLASYAAAVNDRVLVAMINNAAVVLGKIAW